MVKATVEPKNSDTKNGVRVYQWGEDGPMCISVTSVRSLLGQPHALVNWRVNQIADRAIQLASGMAPGSMGVEPDEVVRRWLKDGEGTIDRHSAAELGTAVHQAIELGIAPSDCTDEVRPFIRQFRAMQEEVGFDIVLQERQVWNLAAGYAGTLDAIVRMKKSGELLVVDWKTSKDVYIDYVTQAHAYLAAEFVGNDGVVDEAATKLLHSAHRGAIAKLSPHGWSWHEFNFDPVILRAWMGSLSFARFIFDNPKPSFTDVRSGTDLTQQLEESLDLTG